MSVYIATLNSHKSHRIYIKYIWMPFSRGFVFCHRSSSHDDDKEEKTFLFLPTTLHSWVAYSLLVSHAPL